MTGDIFYGKKSGGMFEKQAQFLGHVLYPISFSCNFCRKYSIILIFKIYIYESIYRYLTPITVTTKAVICPQFNTCTNAITCITYYTEKSCK